MSHDQQSSQGQGFYQPSFQISQLTYQKEILSIQKKHCFQNPIDIITAKRPIDLKPRFLTSQIYNHSLDQVINCSICSIDDETIQPFSPQSFLPKDSKPLKIQRYDSLQAKYKNNQEFQLVFSKIPQHLEFSTYFFSLTRTTDYNPKNFVTPHDIAQSQQSIFDSCFQSGNLLYAYKNTKQQGCPQYDLIMQNDTNTKGYSQWFFFSIRNKKQTRIKLNIVNFVKKNLLFTRGIKPVGLSIISYQNHGIGWKSIGQNITFSKSYIGRLVKQNNINTYKNYYCLSFQIPFEFQNDIIYLAYNFPYTYSKMIKFTKQLMENYNLNQQIAIKRKTLCYSISNNMIPYLIIEDKHKKSKKTILCFGRQHPGEVVSSYVIQGFVKSLLTKPKLIKQYTFIIIPMLNPDGVIYGNFRTNIAGLDLNRQWKQPNRWLHPQTYYILKLIQSLQNLQFCLDIHGHSKKFNSFIYACIDQKIQQFRIYPYIMSQFTEFFSLKDCTFNITSDKIKTARVNLYNLIKKPYIFTLQTSFFGYTKDNKYKRYTINNLQTIGKGCIESLQILFQKKYLCQKMQHELRKKNYLFQKWSLDNLNNSGSQSNPSQDQLSICQRNNKVISEDKIQYLQSKCNKSKKYKKKIKHFSNNKQSTSLPANDKQQNSSKIQKAQSKTIKLSIPNSKKLQTECASSLRRKSALNNPENQSTSQVLQNNISIPIIRPQLIKTMRRSDKNGKKYLGNTLSSNLFNPCHYSKMREHFLNQFSRNQQQIPSFSLCKLQPNKNTTYQQLSDWNYNQKFSRQRQFEQFRQNFLSPKLNKQKIYVIKQSKIIRSFTRIKNQQIRKNLQQSSRKTMGLKNQYQSKIALRIKGQKNIIQPKGRTIQLSKKLQHFSPQKLIKAFNLKHGRSSNDLKSYQKKSQQISTRAT